MPQWASTVGTLGSKREIPVCDRQPASQGGPSFCSSALRAPRTQSMRRFRSIVLLIILTAATSPIFPQSPAHGVKNVFWQPNELQQGSVAFITVELDRVPRRVTGKWIGKDLAFFKSDNPKIWYALAGADLETQPGTYDLTLTAVIVGGKLIHSLKKVNISEAKFRSGAVDVPENFVEPDAASKKQIAADQMLKNLAFSHLIASPQGSGNFVTPETAK